MANLEELVISLRTDVTDALRGLDEVKGKLTGLGKSAQEAQSPVSDLRSGLGKLAGVAAAAFGAFEALSFLKESAHAATENEKSFAMMTLQLQNMTGATREQSDAIDVQLQKLSDLSATKMPVLRNAFDQLVRATGDTTASLKLQGLALDVAAGSQRSLSGVTRALSLAYEGNWGALQRIVPGVKNATDKWAYLNKAFKGAAETAANTDPYSRFQVALEKLQVAFGKDLLPVLTDLVGWFQKFVDLIKPFVPLILGVAAAFATYKVGLILLNAAQAAYNFVVGLSTIATEGFTAALASTGIGAIVIAVGALTAGLIAMNAAANAASNAPKTAAEKAGDAAEAAALKAYDKRTGFGTTVTGRAAQALAAERAALAAKAYNDAYNAYLKAHPTTPDAPKTPTPTGTGTTTTHLTLAQKLAQAQATYHAAVTKDTAKYHANLHALLTSHTAKVKQIMADGAKNLADIIKQSKDLLTNAFKDATAVDASSMFLQAGANITNFLQVMSDKLKSSKQLSDDAGQLAGLGYSQTFIDSIVSQGPQMGDALAQQLIAGGADQAKQVQSMFDQVQNESAHGVDSLADQIYNQSGLATEDLKNQYATAQSDLVTALNAENTAYQNSSDALVRGYEATMARLAIARDRAKRSALEASGVSASSSTIRAINADINAQNAVITRAQTPNPININTVVNATTNATAATIATATTDAIRFNAPVVVSTGSGR